MMRRARGLLLVAALVTIPTLAYAQKTYTPAELRSMVKSGNYPQQGKPITKSEPLGFASCVGKVQAIMDAIGPNYPKQTIASTGSVHMVKLWTNDAAMTLTCSAADKKLVVTASPYL